MAELGDLGTIQTSAGNEVTTEDGLLRVIGIEEWNRIATKVGFRQLKPRYVDQLPPFNITITYANEYGQSAVMRLYGVELLNEGSGVSIDDVVTERACTFVARALDPIQPWNNGKASNPQVLSNRGNRLILKD